MYTFLSSMPLPLALFVLVENGSCIIQNNFTNIIRQKQNQSKKTNSPLNANYYLNKGLIVPDLNRTNAFEVFRNSFLTDKCS